MSTDTSPRTMRIDALVPGIRIIISPFGSPVPATVTKVRSIGREIDVYVNLEIGRGRPAWHFRAFPADTSVLA